MSFFGAETKPYFRVPCITNDMSVSLDEFHTDDIFEYLKSLGEDVPGRCADGIAGDIESGIFISSNELARLQILAAGEQSRSAARNDLLDEINRLTGVRL